eukprot:m.268287 g.268287  ORF g.268287 m.268287 type:complete len:370 (+) comp77831_c0_seq1:97-1206(+)
MFFNNLCLILFAVLPLRSTIATPCSASDVCTVLVGPGFMGYNSSQIAAAVGPAWNVVTDAEDVSKDVLAKVRACVALSNTTASRFAEMPSANFYQFEYTGVSESAIDVIPDRLAVCNCHQSAIPISEYIIANVLGIVVDIRGMDAAMRNDTWKNGPPGNTFPPHTNRPKHRQITGGNLTLGIIGYGSIGRQTASRASVLGLRVIGTTLDPPDVAPSPLAWLGSDKDNERLMRESDFVVIACPLTAATTGLVNATLLRAMKSGAWLLNIARGAIVDESDLWAALQPPTTIGGAVIDVWWNGVSGLTPGGVGPSSWPSAHPFNTLDNVIMSAHASSQTLESEGYSLECVASNLKQFAAGLPLQNVLRNATT